MVDCSIVIPIYNPEKDIEDIMFKQYDSLVLSMPKFCFELIVVDDGSEEGIEGILKILRKRFQIVKYVLQKTNQGKGAALRAGVAKAEGEIILYTDYDFPYKVESMQKMIRTMMEGSDDLAIGVRPEFYYEKIPLQRKLISKALQKMNKHFIKLPSGDTQAGLKAFHSKNKSLFLETTINGFLFDLEFLKLAHAKGLNAALVEIEIREDVHLSSVKLSSLVKELLTYFRLAFK